MKRLLLVLFPALVIAPHLIPGKKPVSAAGAATALAEIPNPKNVPKTAAEMQKLAQEAPLRFLEHALARCDAEVKSFRCTLHKQERVEGKLEKKEVIDVWFRDDPHSVLLKWRDGARMATRSLYVAGENKRSEDGKSMAVTRARAFGLIVEIDPDGPQAKRSGRYPVHEFGIKKGMQRALKAWQDAKNEGALHVEYLGVQKVEELGGRACWVLKRSRFKKPEYDGVAEQLAYFDVENWLLVGSVLRNTEGEMIASYFFRDLEINPKFAVNQFTRDQLKN